MQLKGCSKGVWSVFYTVVLLLRPKQPISAVIPRIILVSVLLSASCCNTVRIRDLLETLKSQILIWLTTGFSNKKLQIETDFSSSFFFSTKALDSRIWSFEDICLLEKKKAAAAASLLVLEHFFMQRLLRTKTIFQNANFAGNNKMAPREKVLTGKVLKGISPDRKKFLLKNILYTKS